LSKRVKIAILGTGFMGRVHLEAVSRLGYVEVAALWTTNLERGSKLAREFSIDRVETDIRRILEDPTIQAVHVCTPNAFHAEAAKDALEAGKHVVCEKPLASSVAEAAAMVALAEKKGLRNCTNHNLRFYPLVQQIRRMREDGDLGEILVVQGGYAQDFLLYDTDWNWRLDAKESGPSCAMADIGSHWCDMAEHVTGLRITELCADLNTFHKTRKRPKEWVETFAGKMDKPQEYEDFAVDNEDFGAVLVHFGEQARGSFTAGEVFAGRKNRLSIEVYGSKASVAWNQEAPDELWIGNRDSYNQTLVKDASLMKAAAQGYSHIPGGHSEGYHDTFKNMFKRFYESVENPSIQPDYPQFADGLRQMRIIETELESSERRGWVAVPSAS
jgi:predicted dehydrogenase